MTEQVIDSKAIIAIAERYDGRPEMLVQILVDVVNELPWAPRH